MLVFRKARKITVPIPRHSFYPTTSHNETAQQVRSARKKRWSRNTIRSLPGNLSNNLVWSYEQSYFLSLSLHISIELKAFPYKLSKIGQNASHDWNQCLNIFYIEEKQKFYNWNVALKPILNSNWDLLSETLSSLSKEVPERLPWREFWEIKRMS